MRNTGIARQAGDDTAARSGCRRSRTEAEALAVDVACVTCETRRWSRPVKTVRLLATRRMTTMREEFQTIEWAEPPLGDLVGGAAALGHRMRTADPCLLYTSPSPRD